MCRPVRALVACLGNKYGFLMHCHISLYGDYWHNPCQHYTLQHAIPTLHCQPMKLAVCDSTIDFQPMKLAVCESIYCYTPADMLALKE